MKQFTAIQCNKLIPFPSFPFPYIAFLRCKYLCLGTALGAVEGVLLNRDDAGWGVSTTRSSPKTIENNDFGKFLCFSTVKYTLSFAVLVKAFGS